MIRFLFRLFVVINFSVFVCAAALAASPLGKISNRRFELPRIDNSRWFLEYKQGCFALEYDTVKKHPKWVAWQLTVSDIGSVDRTDGWNFDKRIAKHFSPSKADFAGYDRGHLCPSGDRTQTVDMNRQTFTYSNMSPQAAGLNRKIWNRLEGMERQWASVAGDTLYICCGGSIMCDTAIMGYTDINRMAIPKYYFKVILRKHSDGRYDAIGFWFRNRDYGKTKLSANHVISVDEVERLTGLDFFVSLPAEVQSKVESKFNLVDWDIPIR